MHHDVARPRVDHPEELATIDRRRAPRVPVPDLIVAVEPTEIEGVVPEAFDAAMDSPAWACAAIDISRDGLGMILPSEVPIGAELLLTFKLDEQTYFSRVSGIVVRKQSGFGLGAVCFHGWTDSDLRALEAFLASHG